MSFLGKANFCVSGHAQHYHLFHVIQSDMFSIYHSPAYFFVLFTFFSKVLYQLWRLPQLQQCLLLLQFPLPDVVVAADGMPSH